MPRVGLVYTTCIYLYIMLFNYKESTTSNNTATGTAGNKTTSLYHTQNRTMKHVYSTVYAECLPKETTNSWRFREHKIFNSQRMAFSFYSHDCKLYLDEDFKSVNMIL